MRISDWSSDVCSSDLEWRADLQIGGDTNQMAISGTANLVRGAYEFAGKRFELTRGQIRFTGEYPPDPTLDIAAEANVQGLSATIRVTATGLRPELTFAIITALPARKSTRLNSSH